MKINIRSINRGWSCTLALLLAFFIQSVSIAQLPDGWKSTDVGDPEQRGEAYYQDGVYGVVAGGRDTWGYTDQFHFIYKKITGDMQVSVRILNIDPVYPASKGLIMIREDFDEDSKCAMLEILPRGGGEMNFNLREQSGGWSGTQVRENINFPYFIRMVRKGDYVQGWKSADGLIWKKIGKSYKLEMDGDVYFGVGACAVTASGSGPLKRTTVEFDQLEIKDVPNPYVVSEPVNDLELNVGTTKEIDITSVFGHNIGDELDIKITNSDEDVLDAEIVDVINDAETSDEPVSKILKLKGLKDGMSAIDLVLDIKGYHLEDRVVIDVKGEAATVPDGWNLINYFEGVEGSVEYEAGIYSMRVGGQDLRSMPSRNYEINEYTYLYRPLKGDVEIIVRMLDNQMYRSSSKSGIFITDNIEDPYSKFIANVYQRTRPKIVYIQNDDRNYSEKSGTSIPALPGWLKMVRVGNLFSNYYSLDGITWTLIDEVTIEMPEEVYFGLGGNSGDPDHLNLNTTTFDQLQVNGLYEVINGVSDMILTNDVKVGIGNVFSSQSAMNIEFENSHPDYVDVSILDDSLVLKPKNPGESKIVLKALLDGNIMATDTFYAIAALMPQPWVKTDIGSMAQPSYVITDDDYFRMSSFGKVIQDNVDNFTFLNLKLSGNYFMSTYVEDIRNTGENTKGGIMFRDTLSQNSMNVSLLCTAFEGLNFQYRWRDEEPTVIKVSEDIKPPCWIKLEKSDNLFIAYTSENGQDWEAHLRYEFPLEMEHTNNNIGLAISSGSYREASVVFTNTVYGVETGVHDIITNEQQFKNYPNPFKGETTFEFYNKQGGKVTLEVFDASGYLIDQPISKYLPEGSHQFLYNAKALSPGIYFCRLSASTGVQTTKMVVIR